MKGKDIVMSKSELKDMKKFQQIYAECFGAAA